MARRPALDILAPSGGFARSAVPRQGVLMEIVRALLSDAYLLLGTVASALTIVKQWKQRNHRDDAS